jgi:hypothetical protein
MTISKRAHHETGDYSSSTRYAIQLSQVFQERDENDSRKRPAIDIVLTFFGSILLISAVARLSSGTGGLFRLLPDRKQL